MFWPRKREKQKQPADPIPQRTKDASKIESLQFNVDAFRRLHRRGETDWGYARQCDDAETARRLVGVPISHADAAAAPGVLAWEKQGSVETRLFQSMFRLGDELLKAVRPADAASLMSEARELDLTIERRKLALRNQAYKRRGEDPKSNLQLFTGLWVLAFDAAVKTNDMDTARSVLEVLSGSGDPAAIMSVEKCGQTGLRAAVAARDMDLVRSVADMVNTYAPGKLAACIDHAKMRFHSRKARKAGAVAFADALDSWLR